MKYRIAVIKGDGVGHEVVNAGLRVLEALSDVVHNLSFEFKEYVFGYTAWKKIGINLPEETINGIAKSDACYAGPHGIGRASPGSPADVPLLEKSPKGSIRKKFDLYALVRPVKAYPIKGCLRSDVDLIVVRENTEGFLADRNVVEGCGEFKPTEDVAISIRVVTRRCSERLARLAFELAKQRGVKKKISVPSKVGFLKLTDGLWLDACRKVSKDYPDITYEELDLMPVITRLIKKPQDFDVIPATNIFGAILGWEAAALIGGEGMVPAANIGDHHAMFEPGHGAAYDIAGKDIVNPLATILAGKMMMEWLGSKHNDKAPFEAAKKIENAVEASIREGKALTRDIGGTTRTSEVTDDLVKRIRL